MSQPPKAKPSRKAAARNALTGAGISAAAKRRKKPSDCVAKQTKSFRLLPETVALVQAHQGHDSETAFVEAAIAAYSRQEQAR